MRSSGPMESGSHGPALHQALVDGLKASGCIGTPLVEAAFRAVPRHLFLPGVPLDLVYSDEAIPTKRLDGAAVSSSSQPAIMAVMLEQLQLEPGHRVLEIGAGTGYNAALMAHIVGDAGHVVTVDIDEDLVASAREHLPAAGLSRVDVVCGDGALGHPDGAPYDRIILTVGAADILPAWWEQLGPDGRLVLPLSLRGPQVSAAFEQANGCLVSVSVTECGFIMLRGAFAEAGTDIPFGPGPGLRLSAGDRSLFDGETAYRWLTDPSRDWPTTVGITAGEAFGSLRLWLALQEAGFCDLIAEGELADRGIVPYLFGWNSNGWKLCCTSGLLGKAGLCVLGRAPDEAPSPEQPRDWAPFDLLVRSFGPDEALAHCLIEQISAWDTAGRPSTDTLRIRACPPESGYVPDATEVVIEKQWTRLVLGWR
jgi:protein-L-isoaspartate(D-aspartate) O-methyltransferase